MISRFYFISILLTLFLSCTYNKDFNNLANIKKGMKMADVDAIMGVPDSSYVNPADRSQIMYRYNATLGMSDDMYIYFSLPDSVVKYVYNGS